MKKIWERIVSLTIIILVLVSCMQVLAYPSVTTASFEKYSANIGLDVVTEKENAAVMEKYSKAVAIMEQHNAVVDQIYALGISAKYICGPIVSRSPFTVEYKSPTKEYVSVGNDYILVTTYYYAVIDNPQDGTVTDGIYSGYHVQTNSATKGNYEYRYYATCGNVFYQLVAQKQQHLNAYENACNEFNTLQDKVFGETVSTNDAFEKKYSPLFTQYLYNSPNRKLVDCLKGEYLGITTLGPTVFRIGCPAYTSSEGVLKPIEKDNQRRPRTDTTPVIVEGSTMIPVRPLIDGLAISATTKWDAATKKVTIRISNSKYVPVCMKDTDIELTVGSKTAILNGEPYEMPQPVQLINGKTMIPLRAVGEMLNCEVEWIAEGRYVVVLPMSVKAFEEAQKAKEKAADPFWGVVEIVQINGKDYYHMPCDTEFWGCEYTFPVTWDEDDSDSFFMSFDSNELEEAEVYADYWGALTRSISSSTSNYLEFTDVTTEEDIGLTVAEFCRKNKCYTSSFREDIVITGIYDDYRDYEFYHLALTDGKITAVTLIDGPTNDARVWDKGSIQTKIDESLLDPQFVVLLKSFQRVGPAG